MPKKDHLTEQSILQAARKVFIQKGLSGARMQDIADEAGINKALLHYYFRNKEKLFETVFQETAQRMFVSIKDIVDSPMTFEEKIRALCDRYITTLSETPFLPLFVLHEIHQNPKRITQFLKGEISNTLQKLFQQIQQEVDSKRVRQVSPTQFITHLISLCIFPFVARPLIKSFFGLDEWQFSLWIEERKVQVADFIINAIRPDGPNKYHQEGSKI